MMALTQPGYSVENIQGLADLTKDQATAVKVLFDKTGADTKTFLVETMIPELNVLDAANMKKTGDQTIAGVKTFSVSPIVPTPTTATQASNKSYVDSQSPLTIGNGSITDLKLSDAVGDIKDRFSAYQAENATIVHPFPILTTAEMQTILDDSRNILFLGGIFNFNPIFVKSNTIITMSPDTVIKALTGFGINDCLVNINNVSNVTIYGNHAIIQMLKAEYTGEQRNGVILRTSKNVSIYDLHSIDSGGDGFYIGDRFTGASENILLSNCYADNNRRQGLSICMGKNIFVLGGVYSNTNGTSPQFGIDVEPDLSTGVIENIYISNVTTSGNSGGGITVVPNGATVSVNISDCISRNDLIGFAVSNNLLTTPTGHVTFSNCKAYNSGWNGVKVTRWTNNGQRVTFNNVQIINPAVLNDTVIGETRLCGFYIGEETAETYELGNVFAFNCSVVDNRTVKLLLTPIVYYAPGGTLKNIHFYGFAASGYTTTSGYMSVLNASNDVTIQSAIECISPTHSGTLSDGKKVNGIVYVLTGLSNIYIPSSNAFIGAEITFKCQTTAGVNLLLYSGDNIHLTPYVCRQVGGLLKIRAIGNATWEVVNIIGAWTAS